MNSITDVIKPIQLLAGTHADTGTTGQGCFMNVIAYLNGEPQITDSSECVCPAIRPVAVWLNDDMRDEERVALIPFIERAMGSRTDDALVMQGRLSMLVAFADGMASRSAGCAADAAMCAVYAAEAAECAAKYAVYAAEAAECAAKYAGYAAKYAMRAAGWYASRDARTRQHTITAALKLLDDMCPPAPDAGTYVVQRAHKLVSLATGG